MARLSSVGGRWHVRPILAHTDYTARSPKVGRCRGHPSMKLGMHGAVTWARPGSKGGGKPPPGEKASPTPHSSWRSGDWNEPPSAMDLIVPCSSRSVAPTGTNFRRRAQKNPHELPVPTYIRGWDRWESSMGRSGLMVVRPSHPTPPPPPRIAWLRRS